MSRNRRTFRSLSRVGCLLVAVAGAAGLAGCQSGGRGPVATSQPTPMGEETPAYNMGASVVDADFLDGMIYYAMLNMQLADLELSNGVRPEVQELAEKTKRRESVDLAFLQAERSRLGVSRAPRSLENDPHAMDDRRRMTATTGEEADAFFVEHMIKHKLEIAKFAESHAAMLTSPNLSYYCRTVADDAGSTLRELRSIQTVAQDVPINARAGLRGYTGSSRR